MRILIYGECEEYGSGAWCYYETLKEMGHEVCYFSPMALLKLYKASIFLRIIRKICRGHILKKHRDDHGKAFLRKAEHFNPEIIIILKGLAISDSMIKKLKKNSWVVQINHDDFFSEFAYNTSNVLLKAMPQYDYIFCTKEINVEEVKKYNRNVEMLMFAYYPKIHFPPEYSDEDQRKWQSDIVFIGNIYPLRKKQLEYLVTHIDRPIDLKIYGPNWPDKINRSSPLGKFIQSRYLGPEEMRKAIYYSKISLGFLCKENRDDYTQRSFEIPACKGMLLAERTRRHLSLYKEDTDAVFFDSYKFDELIDKIKDLLDNPIKTNTIAEQGYQKVISSAHTYKDRLNRMLQIYRASKSC